MAITRLTGFTAEAEILGRLVPVCYQPGNGLLIGCASLEDAYQIIRELAIGKLAAVEPGDQAALATSPGASRTLRAVEPTAPAPPPPAASTPPAAEPVAEKPAAVPAKRRAKAAGGEGADPGAEPAQEPAKPAPEPAKPAATQPLPAPKAAKPAAPPEPVKPAPAAEPAPASAPQVDADPARDVPAAIMGAKKLRDVLVAMIDSGIDTTAGLLAECQRLRDVVPVLRVVQGLEARVERGAEILFAERAEELAQE